tara:strand:- start:2 stop:679 length:678 start_codon:yes stop_codon:yes gene_type:complete
MVILLFILLLLAACEDIPLEDDDVLGCIDETACNYVPDANIDNNDCIYPTDLADDICDCEGSIIDRCNICGGPGYLFNESLEDTWILNYGEYSNQEWNEWNLDNIQTYILDDNDYILNISCDNFNIYWDNEPYLWEFSGTWKPAWKPDDYDETNEDHWTDQYLYLNISLIDWSFKEVPGSYIEYYESPPWFIGYELTQEGNLKIYYRTTQSTYGIDTYSRNFNNR